MQHKFPHYPWWVYDYNSDPMVLAMTDEQDLAYRRLLDQSWDMGPLPKEIERLAVLTRYSMDKFRAVWTYPLTECWNENEGGMLMNSRLEKVRRDVVDRYEQTRMAGRASGKSRRERALNGRSTDVERMLNDPKSNSKKILNNRKDCINTKDLLNRKGGIPVQRNADPATPPKMKRIIGRINWVVDDEGKQKLKASDSFRKEFLACWIQHFTKDEITEQIEKATRWLVPRPKRRGSKSRLDLYLHNWMENALSDKRNLEEEEDRTARRVPKREEPKWCKKCRGDLPEHMSWCSLVKSDDAGGEGGTTPKSTGGSEDGTPGS